MYIKSIVLDGFKSYGNRVEITGFDPEFNAITGLNGTGKSNILDSICFVLGITNLSNVRAGSLQELIYKHGQAGITKATVSVTFDNRDRAHCPIGYEDHPEITVTRQVVMGGKNKYMVNGINVQNKKVSDLFCSVQLNVNNPHFLIMQGRITKVLNMKPAEILSMVEEAAGTRMYEAKKQAAQKTIEKKDAKLKDLNEIIREDIAPRLQKLQDERSQYQEYQKVVRELENLSRLDVAYKFIKAEEHAQAAQLRVTQEQDLVTNLKEETKNNTKAIKEFDKQIAEITTRLNEECVDALRELETQLQALEKAEASTSAAHKAEREALTSHEARARLLERSVRDDEAALCDKRSALGEVESTFENLRTASESSNAELARAQQTFLAVSTGCEGASESLRDQLMAAKQRDSEVITLISQTTMEITHAENRLRQLEMEFNRHSAQFTRDSQEIVRAQAQVDALQAELAGMSHSPERLSALRESVHELRRRARAASDACEALAPRLQRCHFKYTPPVPGFDPRKVLGTVCSLLDVTDPNHCFALDLTAGGRLFNVVVDTEHTGKLLLQHGNIAGRTTMIPLNKIRAHVMDHTVLRKAQEIGGGPENVQLALDLITYSNQVKPAMDWVFGGTLICKDSEIAKRVVFHRAVGRRAITLDGDVCEPGGTLSGGVAYTDSSMLVLLSKFKSLEQERNTANEQLSQKTAELDAMQQLADKYTATQQKYDVKCHELNIVKARLAATSHAQLHAEIESLRTQIAEQKATLENAKLTQIETAAKARELEEKVRDIRGHREREFKKAEEALKKAKKDAERHGGSWKQREQELETLKLEVAELEHAVGNSRQQLHDNRAAAARLRDSLQRAQRDHAAAADAVKEMQARIKRQKTEIASRNTEISHIVQKKEGLLEKNGEIQLRIRELEYTIKELQTEANQQNSRLIKLQDENPWIASERQYFGLVGGMYDFKDANVAGARVAQLRERKDKLARGLNARAHTLLSMEEEQYQDLLTKKAIVETDRAKLVQVMAELDEKKKITLIKACDQVNKDFGSIFQSLLPGAQAKLKPMDGKTVLDGLEIRVGFNNTWKESLGELSGGQRSLVALSLVLAMLRFKPAPLYILDEVDAALDLSHTQNIGQMLKLHFRNSQFIIVSLKDGMFNNANVLFRTRFVDGMSDVQRTVNPRR